MIAISEAIVWAIFGFWTLTVGVLLFAVPTLIIGLQQAQAACEIGYYYTRTRAALHGLQGWMWFRILPDGLMLLGGAVIFYDLLVKTYFSKKIAA